VRTLRAGERATVKAVEVEALRGSLVGPPWAEPQNGYSFRVGDFRVITEPHGNLPAVPYPCDALIIPVVSQRVVGFPLVNGASEALDTVRRLRPKVVVPLENAEIDSSGALAAILEEGGSVPAFQALLRAEHPGTAVVRMQPYRAVPLTPLPEAVAMLATSGEARGPFNPADFLSAFAPFQAQGRKAKIAALKRQLEELVAPLNYGADTTPEQRDAVLALVPEFKALNPTPAPAASRLLDGRWTLLWTTEKEQLFFVKSGLFGSRFTAATQDIDRATGRLQNLIAFEGADHFVVASTLTVVPPARCEFRFSACRCRRGSLTVPLPPVGRGWFDTVFLDDTLRIAEDIRGDTLIVTRDHSGRPFTVPGDP